MPTSGSCTSFMKRMARFSLTMPSLAAKKASTCEMKWRSPSESFSQCFMSSPRSTSSAVLHDKKKGGVNALFMRCRASRAR